MRLSVAGSTFELNFDGWLGEFRNLDLNLNRILLCLWATSQYLVRIIRFERIFRDPKSRVLPSCTIPWCNADYTIFLSIIATALFCVLKVCISTFLSVTGFYCSIIFLFHKSQLLHASAGQYHYHPSPYLFRPLRFSIVLPVFTHLHLGCQ